MDIARNNTAPGNNGPVPEKATDNLDPVNENQMDQSTIDEDLPTGDEITLNDGSIVETLDTAFHGQPGFIDGHSPAGSNRADYYEARSDGRSDAQEETDYLKKLQQDKK